MYDSEEHEKWIKYTDLVANAVMLQNAVNLTQLLKELQTERYEFGRKEVARLSPYLRKHLRRFGDYVFSLEEVPPPITEELLSIELPEKQTDSASEFSPEIQSEVSTENPSELEVEELTDAEDESEVSG